MKARYIIFLLALVVLQKSYAHHLMADPIKLITADTITFKNVKTQSIAIDGITYYYREMGKDKQGIPVIFLNHLAATMDNCDPRIMDGIALQHHLITFDNRGVGATTGKTSKTIAEMASDTRAFIHALGYKKVDLIGFSMGGFIAQEILLQEPDLVRKAILAGTGPAGGEGIDKVTKITYLDLVRGMFSFKDIKTFLFFNRNDVGKNAAKQFIARLKERTADQDKKQSLGSFQRQLKAIHAWALQAPQDLSAIKIPVLVVNGDHDRMVPSKNTYDLNKRITGSELIIYKDSGHGGIFQYHNEFVKSALAFLGR